jgi:WD40 repeat protein
MISPENASAVVSLATLPGHEGEVTAVAYSPDGRTLASGGCDERGIGGVCTGVPIRLWDVGSGGQVALLQGHKGGVTSVAYSPDGHTLASGSWDDTVQLWDVVSGAQTAVLQGHESWVNAVAYSPDGRSLASGSWDSTIRLWGVATT